MPKPRLINNINVYANATQAERMAYARYLADDRAAGRTPEAFADWQRDRETPSSETQPSAGHFLLDGVFDVVRLSLQVRKVPTAVVVPYATSETSSRTLVLKYANE